MKETGMSRPVDGLGRLVLPIEIRRALNISSGTVLTISLDGDAVILKKQPVASACVFCQQIDPEAVHLNGQCVCRACLHALREL